MVGSQYHDECYRKRGSRFVIDPTLYTFTIRFDDIRVINHLGVKKRTTSGLQAYLYRKYLRVFILSKTAPGLLGEYYFIFIHRIRSYSWNEIFNTAPSENTFAIVAKMTRPLNEMGDRILVATSTDFKTGL